MGSEAERTYWRAEARKRYWSDPEVKREAVRRWRRENPERAAEIQREYRKRKKAKLVALRASLDAMLAQHG